MENLTLKLESIARETLENRERFQISAHGDMAAAEHAILSLQDNLRAVAVLFRELVGEIQKAGGAVSLEQAARNVLDDPHASAAARSGAENVIRSRHGQSDSAGLVRVPVLSLAGAGEREHVVRLTERERVFVLSMLQYVGYSDRSHAHPETDGEEPPLTSAEHCAVTAKFSKGDDR